MKTRALRYQTKLNKLSEDLTSTEVPEITSEDLLPIIDRIFNELEDVKGLIEEGFETGDEIRAAEVELKAYRDASKALMDIFKTVKDFREGFADTKNVTYTNVTGDIPKAG